MVIIKKLAKSYAVIEKPVGMPSQPDPSGDLDAMTATSEKLRELGERQELWLVHRLDRTVGGLMVLARTKEAAAELSRQAAGDMLSKEYLAVAEGVPESGIYRDFLFKDSTVSKTFVVKSARRGSKEAELSCTAIITRNNKSLVSIQLKTGRFHQIRAQLASRGNPLVGDGKYGSRDKGSRTPALFAYRLRFNLFGDAVNVSAMPDISSYPWSEFESEIINEVEK